MNILLLGSGGREHAIGWKISQSPLCSSLFIAPGNAGTSQCGKNISIDIKDFSSIKKFVLANKITLMIVGPEDPLVNGIVDFFMDDAELKNVLVVGPSSKGAELEGSKDFAKAFMQRHNIPTAGYRTFNKHEISKGNAFLETLNAPYVLKADGLAAGKGVIIPDTLSEAKEVLNDMLANSRFGNAGNKVVIEEFLKGIEVSVFVITDGNSYKILPEAKDYKRVGENDSGPNTGGMGAVSPVPFADNSFMKKVEERIIKPTIKGLQAENIYYRGFVFIGLMNVNGDPFVIEYNVRMGDPESEVVFPRIKSDIVDLFFNVAKGTLEKSVIEIDPRTVATVMMVSGGYPDDYKKGKEIKLRNELKDSLIFHAGTVSENKKLLTNGGRVLAITSFGKSIKEATEKSYKQIAEIDFENMYFRKDIGKDLIN